MQIMFLYTCTQFCNLIFTYYFASRITDFQYVYVDLCCLMPITIFICWIDPKPELVEYYPPNSLLDPRVFFSIFGHLIITISGIIGTYVFLIHQSFYTPHIAKSTISEGYLIIQIGITYWIILYPLDFMKEAISLVTVPILFRVVIACSTVCTFVLYMIYEHSLYAILSKLVPQKTKKIRKVQLSAK